MGAIMLDVRLAVKQGDVKRNVSGLINGNFPSKSGWEKACDPKMRKEGRVYDFHWWGSTLREREPFP